MKKNFRYDTIFTYGSLQSVGHTMEYFIRHTKKLVIFIVMPRVNGAQNRVRIYNDGKLIQERPVTSSKNIFLYYFLWLYHHNVFLLTYFQKSERVLVFAGHPVAFMGMSIMKLLRQVTYAYWIGDYYPPVHWSLIAFERLKKYYHDRVSFAFYLSDAINIIFNGKVVIAPHHQTVMWGIDPPTFRKPSRRFNILRLLFVGVIKSGQGLEDLIQFVNDNKDMSASIIGVCDKPYAKTIHEIIAQHKVKDRVFFPNEFYTDKDLRTLAQTHHVGIAIYDDSPNSATYYTDPGKVKTYIEMGLPVVMTHTSAIVPYIHKYFAGEVINTISKLPLALKRISAKYAKYQKGAVSFAKHFAYERYYRSKFSVLEHV